MADRNDDREIFVNSEEKYESVLRDRGVSKISHYTTPTVKHPSGNDYSQITESYTIWQTGDKLSRLAGEYYSDERYWWVIALYNKKPTESHFKPGDTVFIPLPLEDALDIMGISDE